MLSETIIMFKGFIVGSSKGGKKWSVRAQAPGQPINGEKLNIASVRVGTVLRPGLDVVFSIENGEAINVAEIQQVKLIRTPKIYDESLNFIFCKLGTEYFVTWTSAFSREEAQEQLIQAGGEEVVLDFLCFSPKDDGGNTAIISALMSSDGSFLQTLEDLLSQVYRLGRSNHYCQQGE